MTSAAMPFAALSGAKLSGAKLSGAKPSADMLRSQIETSLAARIPSALTPAPRSIRPLASTGIPSVDELLGGGVPVGAITEIAGPECSGRTSFALSFLAETTHAEKVCAWIDGCDALDPESAAAAGVDLSKLLWVRCGVHSSGGRGRQSSFALPEKYLVPPPIKKGLHGGGFGPHPRNEIKGISNAVSELLRPEALVPCCAEPQRKKRPEKTAFAPNPRAVVAGRDKKRFSAAKPWSRIEQALRATDLILQGGGFSAIVLDLGGVAPEHALRVPLATWFRYRAVAAQTQASVLLLTQHPCAKSSSELLLRFETGNASREEATVLAGIEYRVEVASRRFAPVTNVTNLAPFRKPPQRATSAAWQGRTPWAGGR